MDYFEGLFLGTLWSDTDFENRRHFGLFFLYGLTIIAMIGLHFFTGQFHWLLAEDQLIKLIVLLILFLASPFLHFRYYRFPLWGKLPVLFLGICKYASATFLMTTFVMPYTQVTMLELQENGINFLNQTLESSTERFAEVAGTFSTVLGVISGGVYLMFLFVLVGFLAIILPGTILLLFRFLQHGYDKLIATFILGRVTDR